MAVSKVILNGNTLIDVTQKTVTSGSMLSGTTSLKNDGTDITGSIATKTSTDMTVSGATVTAPAGYYVSAQSKSVASGEAGTPVATKGTVSNHTIPVTPSVTNTTGYITGGTKTGTAVTVSASELVSGSETKTANGTYDVTNLAELVVNVSGGGGSSYTLIGSGEFTVNTTSTSETEVGNITCTGANLFTLDKLIYVKIRDKNGTSSDHFYGVDQWYGMRSGQSSTSNAVYIRYYYTTFINVYVGTSGVGVYAKTLSNTNNVQIVSKYNSSYSKTINGTYSVEVYKLDWPNNISPIS